MKKVSIFIGFILILNIFLRWLLMSHIPNSVAFQEFEILKLIRITPSFGDFTFRLINIIIGALIDAIVLYLIFKKTKNILLGLCVSIVLSLSPWFFVLSGYLNYFLIPILITVCILAFLPDNTFIFLATICILTIYRYFVINHDLSSFKILSVIPDLIRLFDLKTLFFEGDPSSTMLRIPLTGFFYYLDLMAFFSGLYYLFSINKNNELKKTLNNLLWLGLLFFIVSPVDLLITQRGELVFLWITITIGLGYYNFFRIIFRKNVLYIVPLIALLLTNFIFTAELYLNHFDKINSDDWTYAEQTAVEYLMTKSDTPIYMTNQSDKLYRYWGFLKLNNLRVYEIDDNIMKINCQSQKSICIVKEAELPFFDTNKDEITTSFGNDNGLPIYFVLPSKQLSQKK